MDGFEGAILEGPDIERHVLHDDALGDQAPGHGAHAGHVEQLVNLELGEFLHSTVSTGVRNLLS